MGPSYLKHFAQSRKGAGTKKQLGAGGFAPLRFRVRNFLHDETTLSPFARVSLSESTTFTYANLKVTPEKTGPSGQATVTVDVTNTGKLAGVEPGMFTIMVGPSSRNDKLLTAKFEILER